MGPSKNIVIAAGKSGGHAFPARAVAEALLELEPDLKIHVIHTGSPLEKEIFKNWSAYSLPPLALAGGADLVPRLKTLFFLPLVCVRVFLLMVRLWPGAVFGTGGAISAPVLLSAFLLGRRRATWEGNAMGGLANRFLAPFLPAVFTVFPGIPNISGKKQMLCGYPLRKVFYQSLPPRRQGSNRISTKQMPDMESEHFVSDGKNFPEQAASVIPADKRKRPPDIFAPTKSVIPTKAGISKPDRHNRENSSLFQILVLGGSQGSSLLNQVVSEAFLEESWSRDIFIFHQTGKRDFTSIREKYRDIKNVEVFAFSKQLRDYYEQCDLVFSRAGSGAMAEVSAVGKPLVLVPLSGTAGDHQVKNALHLVERSQAEWISEKELTVETFKKKILQLKEDKKRREILTQNIRKRHKEVGALTIARWLLQEKMPGIK